VIHAVNPSLEVPKEPAYRRAWVVYQLHVRGKSLAQIGRDAGISQQAVSSALHQPNAHIEPLIAKALGLKTQDLFPERFDDAGNRIPRTREKSRSRSADRRNGKGARAA
jgi:Ner family transcriptional regulator